ncbi:MAG: hypothetical protein ACE5HE_08000, partial [Phycisphaerae bacterium]
MSHTRLGAVSSLITLALIGTSHVQAQSLVNLELRAPAVDVVAGTTFEVGLYAVANPGPTQTVGDVRAIFTWDNAVLSFSGVHLDTGHPWQQSGFFLDADGLNTDLTDGLAMYRATAAPGNLGIADTAGLLITKFEFTALVATSPGTTAVDILASAGATPTTTRVLDDVTGGADVTGTLIGDVVTVVVCLSALDCDDTDECTTESCSSGVCSYTLDYIPGVECCNPVTGFTQPIDDGNDCTTDLCGPDGSVTHQNKPFDTPCGRPDEFPCSFQDTCDSSGTCLPNHAANGSFCNEDGDDCTNDFCQDGVCVLNTTDPDGTNCDDGLDVCTPGQDVCQGGVCTGTSDPCLGDPAGPYCVEIGGQAVCRECRVGHPEDCPDNGCVEGFCDLFGTCRPNPDDTLCADGAYCNGVETCNATTGLCDSDPNPQLCIDPAFPFCDEATDTCEVCLVDADCANGITCDGVETCNTGVVPHTCDPGTPLTCPPDEPCATYVCQEPDGSCLRVPINEGLELCNDADGCTVADTCVGGACVGSPPLGIGGVSLALMLPPGAPTQYSVGETIEVDLHAVLYDAIKSCSVSATACTTDADCPVGEFCIFPTSHEFRLIESVLTWDPALLDIDSLNVLDPCDTCDGCRIGCTTDADCLVDV